jgi:hypothetical protein
VTQYGPMSALSQAERDHWLGTPDVPYQSTIVATGDDL